MEANSNLMNSIGELSIFNQSGNRYVAVPISFEMDLELSESVASEITSVIKSYLSNTIYTLEVIGFQPSSKCVTHIFYNCI